MNEVVENEAQVPAVQNDLEVEQAPPRIPQFRRDILPTNLVLSASDIREFAELISDANDRSKRIEIASSVPHNSDNNEEIQQRINELMPVEYSYNAQNGDSVRGLGIPHTDENNFPDDLADFYVSNASFAERAVKQKPMNTVEAYFSFERPTLKLDLLTFPSNPTNNRSVINVIGRDEDWVISTNERIKTFLKKKSTHRPFIHGSGTYDYFIYLIYIPSLILLYIKFNDSQLAGWINSKSIFINVISALYLFLISLLLARFIFQYARWLFAPMEYYKKTRWAAFIHRGIFGAVASTIILAATYDLIKHFVIALFSGS